MKNKIIISLIAITLVLGLIYFSIQVFKKNNITNEITNYDIFEYNQDTETSINNIVEEEIIVSAESEAAIIKDNIKQENSLIKPIEEKKKDVVKDTKQEEVKIENIKQKQKKNNIEPVKENVEIDVKENKKEEMKEPVKENIQKEELEKPTITEEQTKKTEKTEEKEEQQIICNHSNLKYYNSKNEAIAEYERIINEWSDKWINNEIDDETYYKSCPDGYEIFSCPYCKKWTISLYY